MIEIKDDLFWEEKFYSNSKLGHNKYYKDLAPPHKRISTYFKDKLAWTYTAEKHYDTGIRYSINKRGSQAIVQAHKRCSSLELRQRLL